MHFSSIITTLLMQAICISLHFQPIKNFSFLLPTLEEVGELNFKGPLSATSAGHSSVQSTTDTSAGDSSLPAEFDWRDHHKVTSVRDQRQCNACYAFAVTSAIESALAIQYDINIDTTITRSTTITVTNSTSSGNNTENGNSTSNNLSSVHMVNMKQLIDCTFMRNRSRESNTSSSSSSSSVSSYSSSSSTKSNSNYYRNNACQYGYIEDTFRYVVENGLLPEEIYPYEMQKSACRPFPLYTNRTFISGYEKKLNLTENEIKALIYTSGPVITLINDKGLEFLNY
ncbi:PREDICTED: cathepsin O-like, partial [Rhagoletis zephyria]|uniref:cathepsin O-like n=1 Tax=Rhagoletis zephyria TaxID=28612 RepID=UPI0008114384